MGPGWDRTRAPGSAAIKGNTNLILSVCVLYSMIVLGGRFRTRFRVSRILEVVTPSLAVRFHNDKMSSCK